jgi:hypothetical protein
MGVNLIQYADGTFGLQGADNDGGSFIFRDAQYTASSVSQSIFVAPRALMVVGITLRPDVAGTDAGAVTVQVRKVPSGTAIASGTALLSAAMNLKSTANTNVSGSLSTVAGALLIPAGTAIALEFAGVLTAAAGSVSIALRPM